MAESGQSPADVAALAQRKAQKKKEKKEKKVSIYYLTVRHACVKYVCIFSDPGEGKGKETADASTQKNY